MNSSDILEPQLSDLKAVLAVIQDGTLTRAAQRLGLTQPTLSYQLERMRSRFKDPLFVRVGNRMAPTPFAQRLAEPAARVLHIIANEIAGLGAFDPKTTERQFRIGLNEMGAMTLLPKIVRRMASAAPRARLAPVQVDGASIAGSLELGTIDLAAGHFPKAHDLLLQQLLYRRDYVCIARRDHPSIGASLTLRQFGATPQIETPAAPMTREWMEGELSKRRLRATVQMSTQHVAAIPFIVAAGDSIAIIPREVYDMFSPIAAIKVVKLPIAIPAIEIHQYWHPRVASDPALKFLREVIFEAARN